MPALTVAPDIAALRLDAWLARSLPNCGRRRAQRAIAAGAVRVNGRPVRKGSRVSAGDVVEVDEWVGAPDALRANAKLVVPVLYEDAAVIVLDKPAGMPTHALRADDRDTVANFLLARYPQVCRVGKGPLEPGIVHRLDTATSGVLLVARTAEAYAALRRQFAKQEILKDYRAVVRGRVWTAGAVCVPVGPVRRRGSRMRVFRRGAGGRPAHTTFRPIELWGDFTLLAVTITTGVMHQIRVHLASIGHPVVGDQIYGDAVPTPGVRRHLLHAYRIGFVHPTSGRRVEVSSPLPADLLAFRTAHKVTGRSEGSERPVMDPA
jgi:23S rRNA pseudouridine1911/1915/1917 synthase